MHPEPLNAPIERKENTPLDPACSLPIAPISASRSCEKIMAAGGLDNLPQRGHFLTGSYILESYAHSQPIGPRVNDEVERAASSHFTRYTRKYSKNLETSSLIKMKKIDLKSKI